MYYILRIDITVSNYYLSTKYEASIIRNKKIYIY